MCVCVCVCVLRVLRKSLHLKAYELSIVHLEHLEYHLKLFLKHPVYLWRPLGLNLEFFERVLKFFLWRI
jgi:hypothetical protein